jgi:hypothetical protein
VLLELPAPVSVLLSYKQQQQQQHTSGIQAEGIAVSLSGNRQPAVAGTCEAAADQQGSSAQQQPDQQQQQQLVLATRSTLVQLLLRCSDSSVRQQVYCAGLLPRLRDAAALLDEFARWGALQLRHLQQCCAV